MRFLPRWKAGGRPDPIADSLNALHQKQDRIMATVAEILASQAAEDAEIKALIAQAQASAQALKDASAQIADLQAKASAGQGIDPAALDTVKADMDAQAAAMASALSSSGASDSTSSQPAASGNSSQT